MMKTTLTTTIMTGLLAIGSFAQSPSDQTGDTKLIADFTTAESSMRWQTVNDSVMGGISQGDSFVTEGSTLLFKGDISLKNNGGFSSIRSRGSSYDLSAYKGIQLRVKGDGRKYYFTSRARGGRMLAFWSPIQTTKGEWTTIKVPLSSFYATSFGRKIPSVKLDTKNIKSLGFMLYDKKSGSFQLEVDEIKAYK